MRESLRSASTKALWLGAWLLLASTATLVAVGAAKGQAPADIRPRFLAVDHAIALTEATLAYVGKSVDCRAATATFATLKAEMEDGGDPAELETKLRALRRKVLFSHHATLDLSADEWHAIVSWLDPRAHRREGFHVEAGECMAEAGAGWGCEGHHERQGIGLCEA